MDTITLILIIGLAAQGLAFAALILAGTGPCICRPDSCRSDLCLERSLARPHSQSHCRRRPGITLAGPLYAWNGDSPLGEEQSTTERRAAIDGSTALTEPLPTKTESNPCRTTVCMERRLPQGGAEHDETACDRDSPLGEEQSTTERRATETPL